MVCAVVLPLLMLVLTHWLLVRALSTCFFVCLLWPSRHLDNICKYRTSGFELFPPLLQPLNASYNNALKLSNNEHKSQPMVLLLPLVLCMQEVLGQSCGVRTQTVSWSLLIACCLVPRGAVRCGLCFVTKFHNACKYSVLHCTTKMQQTFLNCSTEIHCTALYFNVHY